MKRLVVTILSILIIALVGCDNDTVPELNLMTVPMIDNIDADLFKKTVVLYEDDEYLISTYFDKYISSYPYDILYGYDELKKQAIQDTLTQDTLQMKNYVRQNDGIYTLAYHLENGSCLIYSKRLNEIIEIIEMENYSTGGPMTTTQGRKFYIRGTLFLETVDLMS